MRARLLIGASVAVLAMSSGAALAQEREAITIAPQSLTAALQEFGSQTSRQVMFAPGLIASKKSGGVSAATDEQIALAQLLQGTGLGFRREGDVYLIERVAADPQSDSAAGGGAEVEALIVTAQKREEDIQDVPIAISAFSQEQLERSQIAGGPDLMTQVPNMTFTKTNFASYSIQIRGIGTQAISATTDAAVAVAFNNQPFIRNRFFEQEFYDLQRVEVLRGPQGTLYGRNATAGVVNIISAKPTFGYEAKISGDVSNYSSTRVEGMLNIPLAEDVASLRIAGAWTKREGFVTNEISGNPIDGRDLWSTRVSLRLAPTDGVEANLIWEHFQEDDDRLRSGKQVCNRHVVTQIGGIPVAYGGDGFDAYNGQANFSQGCIPASMYAPESYQAPNGFSLPYYHALGALGFYDINGFDPYLSLTQSRDLRVIESTLDPEYRAKSDLVELQFNVDISSDLTVTSETGYSTDRLFSFQDYNRFNTREGAFRVPEPNDVDYRPGLFNENGEFCDPQLGCASRLVAADVSTAKSVQFSQELRIGSDYGGPFNFSLGANFLRYDTEDRYYVFINTLTLFAASRGSGGQTVNSLPAWVPGESDNLTCLRPNGPDYPDPNQALSVVGCNYIDPNPISSLNGEGHNYFLSRNPYKLISYAVFGEAYYNIAENLKVTAGLRWTVDKKEAPRIPSWVLGADAVGYPVAEVIEQEWREPTGRLTVDWKPDFSFTDDTLLYASYAHGYKAGGANPPAAGTVFYGTEFGAAPGLLEESKTAPKRFDPEFVDAFEVGSKNTLLDGKLTFNTAAFYYDYQGYQISYITDRSAVNLNFDAKVWGLELEADWRPFENLRLGFKGGYENTNVADGERAVDVMDRTAGHDDWIVIRPHPTQSSNCIIPKFLVTWRETQISIPGAVGSGGSSACELAWTQGLPISFVAGPSWDPATAPPEVNNGEGFYKELGGNELPNAPHYTATLTADYTIPLPNNWLATFHTDLYYQSEAWTRIFNMEGYDKLKAYTNLNLAAIFTNEDAGWKVMAYVKNVMDRDSITGAFLNSDDTGLTTNVFLTEPRLYGLRVTKEFSGGPWRTGANLSHTGPWPLTVELGGQAQRHDAPYETVTPSFDAAFADEIATVAQTQHNDLDWGDGRHIKLTYRPGSGPWEVSAAVRYGRTNGSGPIVRAEEATASYCGVPYQALCAKYPGPLEDEGFYTSKLNWSRSKSKDREEHEIVDFAVSRDIGLGGLEGSLSLGLRYAKFESSTSLETMGNSDWSVPFGFLKYDGDRTYREAELTAEREFEGSGPVFSWDGAQNLWGSEDAGLLALDWSIGGGVLFGKHETTLTGFEKTVFYELNAGADILAGWNFSGASPDPIVTAPDIDSERSDEVTVPLLDLSLGLSYDVGRIRVGAGYRWERYFDVLDVGDDTAKDSDRTIDGPYFKIAVGFGG